MKKCLATAGHLRPASGLHRLDLAEGAVSGRCHLVIGPPRTSSKFSPWR